MCKEVDRIVVQSQESQGKRDNTEDLETPIFIWEKGLNETKTDRLVTTGVRPVEDVDPWQKTHKSFKSRKSSLNTCKKLHLPWIKFGKHPTQLIYVF